MGPEPLIVLLQQGYGIVAAEVVEARPVKVEGEHKYPYGYDVTFRVHQVIAQPVKGEPFALKPGERLVVQITVGYGCMIEHWGMPGIKGGGRNARRKGGPLAAGTRYYLTLERDTTKQAWNHARGASVLRPVERFARERAGEVRGTRALAALPDADRVRRCRELLLARDTQPFLRMQALLETQRRADRADERRAILACYWALWDGDKSHLAPRFVDSLDYALRRTVGERFETSAKRRDYWLARFLAPLQSDSPAARHSECIERNNRLTHYIVECGKAHPDTIGARLMKELDNPAWPPDIHVIIVRCLLFMSHDVGHVPEAWDAVLQGRLPRLIDRSHGWPLRLLVANLERGVRSSSGFRPGPATLGALERARDRMQKLADAKDKTDPDANNAAHCIRRFLAALK